MIQRWDEVVRGRPLVAVGSADYIARAVASGDVRFEYVIDPARLDEGLVQLVAEKRDIVVVIFARSVGAIAAALSQHGFTWLDQVFDARFFGLAGSHVSDYAIIDGVDGLEASDTIEVHTAGAALRIGKVVVPRDPHADRIQLCAGAGSAVDIGDCVIEPGVTVCVAAGGRFRLGAGASLRSGTRVNVGVGAGVDIGSGVLISPGSTLDAANGVEIAIGDASTFGPNLQLFGYASIRVGRDCMCSSSVYIESGAGHDLVVDGKRRQPAPVSIGAHVWLGMNACVLAGGSIGDDSVVGAMSVVTHSFGSRQLIVGNPARVLKEGIRWDRDYTAYKALHDRA